MWAQMISVRLKAGHEGDLGRLEQKIREAEQTDSGLLHSFMMQRQNDPRQLCMLVVFESEEKARARESDPRRQESLQAARAIMAEIFDGAPEFADLTVVETFTP